MAPWNIPESKANMLIGKYLAQTCKVHLVVVSDHILTLNKLLWSSFGTGLRPHPPNGLGVDDLVWWPRSFPPKEWHKGRKKNRVWFKQTEHCKQLPPSTCQPVTFLTSNWWLCWPQSVGRNFCSFCNLQKSLINTDKHYKKIGMHACKCNFLERWLILVIPCKK